MQKTSFLTPSANQVIPLIVTDTIPNVTTMRNVTLLADDVIYESWHSLVPVVVALVKVKILNNTQFQTHTQKLIKFVSAHVCIPWAVAEVIRLWPTYGTESSHEWVHALVFGGLPRAEVLQVEDVTRNRVAHDDPLNMIPLMMQNNLWVWKRKENNEICGFMR